MIWPRSRLYTRLWMHVVSMAMCVLLMLPASSAATGDRAAGLIVDYGDGRYTYAWVPLEQAEISAMDMLKRTDLELVTVDFGGLGVAICQIDNTGCGPDACSSRMCQTSSSSPFWRFLKLQDGEWKMVGTGVSGARVTAGDIYALSWSAQMPPLTIYSFDEFALELGVDDDEVDVVVRNIGAWEAESSGEWWPAIGATAGVALLAGVLVLRSRSLQAASR